MSQDASWPREALPQKPSQVNACADLHIHTNASDGCFSPAEIVRLAATQGFSAISICDHDTVAGLDEGIATAEETGLELIPGVEMSTHLGKSEVHILGYCLDYRNPSLTDVLRRLCHDRLARMERMLDLLAKLGIILDRSKIDRAADFGCVGRMHIARALVEQGFVPDTREAFTRFIGLGKPAYVPRAHFSSGDACRLITQVRGVPVLAHPSLLDSDKLIPKLVKEGIMGIEAFYGKVTPDVAHHYCQLAEKWELLVTGGSDCHQSENGEFLLGTVKLDYEYVRKLKEKASELSSS